MPLTLAMSSKGGWPTLALLLILALRRWRPAQGLLFGAVLAASALVSETTFVAAWGGLAIGVLLAMGRRVLLRQPLSGLFNWTWPLLPGAVLAPVMGGALTVTLQNALLAVRGAEVTSIMVPPIGFRWPPALLSGHLGTLSITEPGQLVIALAEIGPLLLLAPWVSWAAIGHIRSRKLFEGGLAIMAIVNFSVPLVLRFVERDRDIVRLAAEALKIWMLLGVPYAWLAFQRRGRAVRSTIALAYALTILGGLALLPSQIIAISRPQLSSFIDQTDAVLSRKYWDRLEKDAWILDPAHPYRPMVLFGRGAGPAYETIYYRLASFEALLKDPDPAAFARAGYDYVYLERASWQRLNRQQRRAFQRPCVQLVAEQKSTSGDFRRLLDIRACGVETGRTAEPGRIRW
jgi:hypothetical protein